MLYEYRINHQAECLEYRVFPYEDLTGINCEHMMGETVIIDEDIPNPDLVRLHYLGHIHYYTEYWLHRYNRAYLEKIFSFIAEIDAQFVNDN